MIKILYYAWPEVGVMILHDYSLDIQINVWNECSRVNHHCILFYMVVGNKDHIICNI